MHDNFRVHAHANTSRWLAVFKVHSFTGINGTHLRRLRFIARLQATFTKLLNERTANAGFVTEM
jgi:hypothetical protein